MARPPEEAGPLRSFVAVLLEGAVLEELQAFQRMLRARLPESVRWARAEQLHLTLHFLGDTDPEALSEAGAWLAEACKSQRPFPLCLGQLGVFPGPRRPRVLWVGLAGDVPTLLRLQSEVSGAVARFGRHAETREFHPHLTLGRVRVDARVDAGFWPAACSVGDPRPVSWTVREVQLMRSELRPSGAQYTVLRTVPLG